MGCLGGVLDKDFGVGRITVLAEAKRARAWASLSPVCQKLHSDTINSMHECPTPGNTLNI